MRVADELLAFGGVFSTTPAREQKPDHDLAVILPGAGPSCPLDQARRDMAKQAPARETRRPYDAVPKSIAVGQT